MRSGVWQPERLLRAIQANPLVAGIVITAITAVLIGGVVVTMTSAGCGAARALHLSGVASRCGSSLTAAHSSPGTPTILSPFPTSSNFPSPTSTVSSQPLPPTASPTVGPLPPNTGDASPAYPVSPPVTGPVPGGPALNCRLPVFAGGSGSGGFIVFPGNTFIADPTSGVTLPSPSPPYSPAPGGPGYGNTAALSYDRAYSQWLPVALSSVAPDGKRYAFAGANGIYVKNVIDGTLTELGDGHTWTVVGVGPNGVYAEISGSAGLWLLPWSGSSQQIATIGYWQGVGGGAAYGAATSAVPQGASNTIIRLDLSTGSVDSWFTRPSSQASVAGFDSAGNPILYVYTPRGEEVWIISAPNSGTFVVASFAQFNVNGSPVADHNGVWFAGYFNSPPYTGGYNGPAIILYIPGSGIYSMSSFGAQLAGGCG
jgi:hypothetical protein